MVQIMGRDEDLPTVAELDPYRLGATSSPFGRAGHFRVRDGYVARTANRVDARLAKAFRGNQLVVVVGPSKAGKTRTLFEAIHAYDSTARLVCPVVDQIADLAATPRIRDSDDTLVVWLDDLHMYLTGNAGDLTSTVLDALTRRRGRTLVVATLRSEMRAQLRGDGEMRRETRMLLDQALLIELASTDDDPEERAAAERTYPELAFDGHGLGEVLAGAPELLDRYDDARADDPLLHTVIAVAVDWARIGRTEPIPESTLTRLTMRAMRTTYPHVNATDEDVQTAIISARRPPPGAGRAAALRTTYLDGDDDGDTRSYRAFDYLVAADDGQNQRVPRRITESFWHNATYNATPETLTAVGYVASWREATAIASTLFRRAADSGHSPAMYSLGSLLHELGNTSEAECWYRKAAGTGHASAMSSLGFMLDERGDASEAEIWFRKAAEAGNASAMVSLGTMHHERAEVDEAETWYRKSAETGHASAMFSLGLVFNERGDAGEAETWFRKSAETGHVRAMFSLGVLLDERGDIGEAETWFRRSADTSHLPAMSSLGVLLHDRGNLDEAETWYRKAAEAGHSSAMSSLGVLLHDRGNLDEAETWYRKAAEAGHSSAMSSLGV
ncbi:tetratricopeptide repeat protein, partial [Nocardia sp. NPDC055049]